MPDLSAPVASACRSIEDRFRDLRPRLGGAMILGERSLRYWVLREIFETLLGWPYQSIIVGESYDALLLDSRKRPVIYLETKDLGRRVPKAEIDAAKNRFELVPSLELLVFTDALEWFVRTRAGAVTRWALDRQAGDFFAPLAFTRFSG